MAVEIIMCLPRRRPLPSRVYNIVLRGLITRRIDFDLTTTMIDNYYSSRAFNITYYFCFCYLVESNLILPGIVYISLELN